jgi:hypothetical protein
VAWVEKTRKDKGHAWRVGYRGPDRRQRYKTFTRKTDADLFAVTVETDMSRGDWTDPRLGRIAVTEEALDDARFSDRSTLSRLPEYGDGTQLLRYIAEGALNAHSIPIRSEGVLAGLADAAHWVTARYGWTEAATTTFIPTDRPPAAVGIKARKVEPWPRSKASRRIELDLPLSATKEEAADRYVQVRDEMLRDEPKSRRSLTQDTSDLAVFAARHRSGYTWEEARAIWNDHRTGAKQRRYDDPAQFMRDSRKAYERVTGQKLDWIGKSASHTPPLRNESKET